MNTAEPAPQGKKSGRENKTKTSDQLGGFQTERQVDITELAERARSRLEKNVNTPLDMAELTEQAKSQIAKLTGLKPVTITGAMRDEKGWHVVIDMLEMSRIPASTDILGEYELLLDDNGKLLSFERKRTHLRGQTTEK